MPEDRRTSLWHETESWLSHMSQLSPKDLASLETDLDLDIAYELAWRLDRCLFPLTNEFAAFLNLVAGKYSDGAVTLPEKSVWTRTSVSKAVTDIRLWLLRHYREMGLVEQWQVVKQAIEVKSETLSPEHRIRLMLEEALHALSQFDPAEAKRLLTNWKTDVSLPFWESRRAALMAELGEISAAHSILESSLSAIRRQLSRKPIIDDYTLVSQESVVMLLLWAVVSYKALTGQSTKVANLLDELSERWNRLSGYKCDPRREILSLSARLERRPDSRGQEGRSHSFDLGITSSRIHFGFDDEARAAYGLLRMYEAFGMPYRISRTTFAQQHISSTLPYIRPFHPHWALANIIRLGEARNVNLLFDREFLSRHSRQDIDNLLEAYLPAFEHSIKMIDNSGHPVDREFELLAKILPEVCSRLCYKCSPKHRESLVSILREMYASKRIGDFAQIRIFAERLFDSMSILERCRAVPMLVDFPIPQCPKEIQGERYPNPLVLVDPTGIIRGDIIPVSLEKVDELLLQFSEADSDCDWTATTLVWLHHREKFNDEQSKRLGQLLWNCVDPPSTPNVPGFRSFACMGWPRPADIDAEARVKKRIRETIHERIGDSRWDDALEELGYSAESVQWTLVEALEFLAKISEWWEEHKKLLDRQTPSLFQSPAESTKTTMTKAVHALSSLLIHSQADADAAEGIGGLRAFCEDLAANDIPAKALEVAALSISAENESQVLQNVAAAMLDKDALVVRDALNAAYVLVRVLPKEMRPRGFEDVLTMLVQGVQWRHPPALPERLSIVANLVKSHSGVFSDHALLGLLGGLENIADETSKPVKGNDEEGVISIRKAAANLAFSLFKHHPDLVSNDSGVIQRWQSICDHPDEFAEVRNSWAP